MLSANLLERKLQISGILLILALLVETGCLLVRGPLAFIVFSGLGGILFAAGIITYLFSLVSSAVHRPPSRP